jgi:Ca-activated chloride channel family protein
MPRRIGTTATLIAVLLAVAGSAAAQIVPPEPPRPWPGEVVVEDYRVEVLIENQIATTTVTQVLANRGDWQAEATFLHPLPPGAAVTDLVLWIDGEPERGEVLPAGEARSIYEEIIASLRDPALVEYVDHGLVRASVFPIPPGGERKVELTYTQVLEADQGLVRYLHPFGREARIRHAIEHLSLSVDLRTDGELKTVYSPSHEVSIDRRGADRALIGYETTEGVADADFTLYYSAGDGQVGLDLITYRDPTAADPSGYFVLLAGPGAAEGAAVVAKDVIIVIDRSGSMEGEKFRQAQDAVGYVLEHLNDDDRFTVVTFSTGVDTFSDRLQTVRRAPEAVEWVEALSPAGSTDIDAALSEAFDIAGVERPTYVLFLTDGLPTEGVIDTDEILERAHRSAPANMRLFSFGVGWDVDTVLLDTLAGDHGGTTTYVTPGEEIDVAVAALYAKVSSPVLTDPVLDFGDLKVFDLYPGTVPDLFAGEQAVLVGRYREGGIADITLRGMVDGEERAMAFTERVFADTGGNGAVPRLWATRKIGHLGDAELSRISEEAASVAAATTVPVSGEDAVAAAEASGDLAARDVAAPSGEYRDLVTVAGTRTLRWSDGIWVDTAFDPETMTPIAVPFASEDYFALAAADPDIAAALASAERVLVVSGDRAYEIVDADAAGDPVEIPDTTALSSAVTTTPAGPGEGTLAAAGTEQPGGGFPGWAIALIGLVVGGAAAGVASRQRTTVG